MNYFLLFSLIAIFTIFLISLSASAYATDEIPVGHNNTSIVFDVDTNTLKINWDFTNDYSSCLISNAGAPVNVRNTPSVNCKSEIIVNLADESTFINNNRYASDIIISGVIDGTDVQRMILFSFNYNDLSVASFEDRLSDGTFYKIIKSISVIQDKSMTEIYYDSVFYQESIWVFKSYYSNFTDLTPPPEPLEFTATVNATSGSVLFEWSNPHSDSFIAYSFTICYNNIEFFSVLCSEYALVNYNNSITISDLVKGVEYTIILKTVTSASSFVWTYGNDEYPILLVTIPNDNIESVIEIKKNGSGCNADCEAPTFGSNSEYLPRVQHGLTLNGNTFDVDPFFTHIPMQFTKVNQVNELTFKIFENTGIYNIEFVQFGTVKEIGDSVNDSEFLIEIDIGTFFHDIENPILESVTVHDNENLISDPSIELSVVECGYVNAECLQGKITWSYRESPIGKVLVLETWDNSRNSNRSYFNDGLTVSNPNHIESEIEITPYQSQRLIDPIQNVMTRANSNFADIVLYEENRAVKIYNSTHYISVPLDSFSYDLPTSKEERQSDLNKRLLQELIRITPLTKDYSLNQNLYQKDSYNHWNYYGQSTIPQILHTDLEQKIASQEKIYQQKLETSVKYSN